MREITPLLSAVLPSTGGFLLVRIDLPSDAYYAVCTVWSGAQRIQHADGAFMLGCGMFGERRTS